MFKSTVVLLIMSLLFFGIFSSPAFAQFPQDPNHTEKDLFNTIFNRLNDSISKGLVPHSVNNTSDSFFSPVLIEIDCSEVKEIEKVEIKVTTRLINWNKTEADRLGDRTAMAYFWNEPVVKIENKIKKLNFTNYLMIDSVNATKQEKDTLGQIINEALLYHEMLHGQLLIDAMKNGANWKAKICKCEFDLGPSDMEHTRIYDLESDYRRRLGTDRGYEIVEKKIITEADINGNFEEEIADIAELKGKTIITPTIYVPPGGNVEAANLEFPSGETGPIKIKGKLRDENKEGKVEAYIDPDNIGIFADITVKPYIEVMPTANPLLTVGVLGIAIVLFLRKEMR
ncbi:VPXXXP-CTERM sorting domain-containing protein [Methanolobus sp. ZRKC3]|uniref:VPXXXP-CTERM sorting domain-containing protein n=1 Tax=Methanolobus sp. ZRKC3 TaxID=3125786 RepID=UPI00324ED80C